jgi:tripartite-type tricarboxylate transporter receptor subunit TctC
MNNGFFSSLTRRSLALALASTAMGLSFGALAQGAYPDRPVKLVVPYAPGGTADVLAREIAAQLTVELGQSVVIENKAGAGAAIGARFVAGSPADGYTLLMGTSTTHAINPALNESIGYDPIADFTPIAAVGDVPYAIVTTPAKGWRNLKDLKAAALGGDRVPSYASAGPGSANHLGGVLLSQVAGANYLHVPYKGSAPALADVLAGHADFMFDLVTTAKGAVSDGRLVALATTGRRRAESLPNVPTVAEQGMPGLQMSSWFGVFAPHDLPKPVANRLIAGFSKVLEKSETQARLKSLGLSLMEQRGKAFADFVVADYNAWRKVAKQSNLKIGS